MSVEVREVQPHEYKAAGEATASAWLAPRRLYDRLGFVDTGERTSDLQFIACLDLTLPTPALMITRPETGT